MGIGDWGLGEVDLAQFPTPHPPCPNPASHVTKPKQHQIINIKIIKLYLI